MQSVRINNSIGKKREVICGVQGSVFGPLLFNIDLINLFLKCEDNNINTTTLMGLLLFHIDVIYIFLECEDNNINRTTPPPTLVQQISLN